MRDTYHQYRLRKPKVGESLSKWRYAKEMEFLSNVYQPKLKSLRGQHFINNHNHSLNSLATNNGIENNLNLHHHILKKHGRHEEDEDDNDDTDDLDPHNHNHDHCQVNVSSQDIVSGDIITVNETDAFILTAYDDVSHDNDISNDGSRLVGPGELSHHHESSNLEICMDIVKHEQHNSLDNESSQHDGEVDYEEVCLYEETGNPSGVDCDSIISSAPNSSNGHHHQHHHNQHQHSNEPKFEYISTGDFCIGTLNPVVTRCTQFSNVTNTNVMCTSTTSTIKLRTLSPICNNSTIPISITSASIDASTPTITIPQDNNITTHSSTPSGINLTPATVHLHPINELSHVSCITNAISPVTTATPTASASSSASSSNCSTNKQTLETSNNVLQVPQASIITFPPSTAATICTNGAPGATAMAVPANSLYYGQQRDECDLFFDFLKKKIQSFPPREITAIQVEFLNCVLRHEAAYAQRLQNSTNNIDPTTVSTARNTLNS